MLWKVVKIKYLCTRKQLENLSDLKGDLHQKGLVAQLNSASDYGSEGYWFESSRGHKKGTKKFLRPFFITKNIGA